MVAAPPMQKPPTATFWSFAQELHAPRMSCSAASGKLSWTSSGWFVGGFGDLAAVKVRHKGAVASFGEAGPQFS